MRYVSAKDNASVFPSISQLAKSLQFDKINSDFVSDLWICPSFIDTNSLVITTDEKTSFLSSSFTKAVNTSYKK